MKRRAILLGMAFAACAAHAQAGETGLNAAGETESDVGLGLFGSSHALARVLSAWAELGKLGVERHQPLSTNTEHADGMTSLNPPEVPGATQGFAPAGGEPLVATRAIQVLAKRLV